MTIKLSRKYVVICIQGVDKMKVYYLIKPRFSSRGKVTLRSILQSIKAQTQTRMLVSVFSISQSHRKRAKVLQEVCRADRGVWTKDGKRPS